MYLIKTQVFQALGQTEQENNFSWLQCRGILMTCTKCSTSLLLRLHGKSLVFAVLKQWANKMLFAVLIYSVIVAVDFFKVDFFNNLTLASEITLCAWRTYCSEAKVRNQFCILAKILQSYIPCACKQLWWVQCRYSSMGLNVVCPCLPFWGTRKDSG